MTVVLHIGAHKTGTSLIQKYFRDKIEDFAPGAVTAVPRGDTNKLIGWGEKPQERPKRLRRRLESELRKAPNTVLVSHENTLGRPVLPGRAGLYPDAAELAASLALAVEGLDVAVVFYVRPVAAFVESYYLQTIHEGAAHSFDEWFAQLDADSLSWQPLVEALDDIFGRERTLIGDFEEVKSGQNHFLEAFMQRTGIEAPNQVLYRPRRNASISSVGLEIARNVNPHLTTRDQRVATRKFLQEHFSNVEGDRARPMPDDVRQMLTDQTEQEYAVLAQRARAALV